MNNQLTMFPEIEEPQPIRFMVLELCPVETTCGICGKPLVLTMSGGYGLPMYEGKVVNPDIHEWAGYFVCKQCYEDNEYKTHLDVFGIPRDVPL